ncbi:MAG TPA: phosphate ABC transporter substrate-binding protein PstS [Fimbriiglobus sp.]|nr:phosphate ABC transporter substrate-binding protein PstS [Fimbriiglobus sp.]
MRCLRSLLIGLVLAPVLGGCSRTGGDRTRLDGQGSTFVEPILKVWANEYDELTDGAIQVNYQGTGSGAGVSQMTRGLADFGCTDAPMNKAQLDEALATSGPVVHVPLVIGAIVPVYNLPGVAAPLTFTGPLLANIFTGKVAKWNDPRIAALNPGVNLPDLGIQPVYRADPSGTSFIFSDYLAKVSPEFKASVGASTTPNWPSGIGTRQSRSDGVAGHITRNPGAIGYLELTYTLDSKDKLKYGKVRNKAGQDVLADLDGITAAAAASLNVKPTAEPYSLHELTYNLTDAAGEQSYPIAGMSFAVLYRKQQGAKGKAVVGFLKWCTGADGQKLAKLRNYAPLPEELRKKVHEALGTVEIQ